MNIFVKSLADDSLGSKPDLADGKLVVEDNVGEGIHIHIRNVRLEMTIEDFRKFSDELEKAQGEMSNGNR